MSERGVFAVDRGIFDHPLFNSRDPFTRREAWLWLVSEAAWRDRTVYIGGKKISLKRGQLSHSLRFIALKWGWSKSTVARFFDALQTDTMIGTESGVGQIVITICNYDEYQRVSLPDRDNKRDASRDNVGTVAGQQRDKEESIEDIELDIGVKSDFPMDAFERFYERYPHKVGKAAAKRAFDSVRKQRRALFATLMDGLDAYIRTKPIDRAWCNPATWLNQDRWDDKPNLTPERRFNGGRNGTANRKDEWRETLDRLGEYAHGSDPEPDAVPEMWPETGQRSG